MTGPGSPKTNRDPATPPVTPIDLQGDGANSPMMHFTTFVLGPDQVWAKLGGLKLLGMKTWVAMNCPYWTMVINPSMRICQNPLKDSHDGMGNDLAAWSFIHRVMYLSKTFPYKLLGLVAKPCITYQ